VDEKRIPLRLALPYVRLALDKHVRDPSYRLSLYEPIQLLFPQIELSGVPRGLPQIGVSNAGEHPELLVKVDLDSHSSHFVYEFAVVAVPNPKRMLIMQNKQPAFRWQSPDELVLEATYTLRLTAQRNGVGYSEKHATGSATHVAETIYSALVG